jgi:hypothetical protein
MIQPLVHHEVGTILKHSRGHVDEPEGYEEWSSNLIARAEIVMLWIVEVDVLGKGKCSLV